MLQKNNGTCGIHGPQLADAFGLGTLREDLGKTLRVRFFPGREGLRVP